MNNTMNTLTDIRRLYSVTSTELNEKPISINYLGKLQISGSFWKKKIHVSKTKSQ